MDTKAYINKQLDDLTRGLDRYLEGLTDEEVRWAPQPDAGSIIEHLLHIAIFEDEFVQERALGRQRLESTHAGPVDDGADDYHSVLDYYRLVRAATLRFARDLPEDQLESVVLLPHGEDTVANVLSIVAAHHAQHMGAITYLRRLQRGPAGVEHG
jgi:uncharacterized damage-inducible protein DinB